MFEIVSGCTPIDPDLFWCPAGHGSGPTGKNKFGSANFYLKAQLIYKLVQFVLVTFFWLDNDSQVGTKKKKT